MLDIKGSRVKTKLKLISQGSIKPKHYSPSIKHEDLSRCTHVQDKDLESNKYFPISSQSSVAKFRVKSVKKGTEKKPDSQSLLKIFKGKKKLNIHLNKNVQNSADIDPSMMSITPKINEKQLRYRIKKMSQSLNQLDISSAQDHLDPLKFNLEKSRASLNQETGQRKVKTQVVNSFEQRRVYN